MITQSVIEKTFETASQKVKLYSIFESKKVQYGFISACSQAVAKKKNVIENLWAESRSQAMRLFRQRRAATERQKKKPKEISKRVDMYQKMLGSLLPRLDAVLTGKNIKTTMATWNQSEMTIEKFSFGELYYLSDGGYSRVFFVPEEKKMFLTDNSLEKPKQMLKSDVVENLMEQIEQVCTGFLGSN